MVPASTIQRSRRRPRASRRDWIIVIGISVLVLASAAMVFALPRLRSTSPSSTNVQVNVAAAAPNGAPTAAAQASPYFQWDYVWGLTHPALDAPKSPARSELLVDLDSQHVLYARNPTARMANASTTKLMTAMVALDSAAPDTVVTVPDDATKVEPDHMGLTAGEKVKVGDLLYGLLLDSGNDAAETLAMTTLGREPFIKAMNDKAASLGLQDTHFANPSGLDDPDQYSSAQDLAIIAGYIYQRYPAIDTAVTTRTQSIIGTPDHKAFFPQNFNKLLWSYPGAIGFKTGQTDNAGTCLVSGARRGDRTLLLVELNDPVIFTDATTMLNFGFSKAG